MAGASMNDIKARIKSVESTMQITKAMELVATSKLRRAKEKAERTRPFYEVLGKAIDDVLASEDANESVWCERRAVNRTLYIVIAGDRGLAGGYNANVFRLAESIAKDGEATFIPIGKKALEYYRHRDRSICTEDFEYASTLGVSSAIELGRLASSGFLNGSYDRVVLVYTKFVSMMTQTPVITDVLPLKFSSENNNSAEPIYEGELDEIIGAIVPEYVGGLIHSAICESAAAECAARRCAMNSANKNAEEMISTLVLKFNRARQAVITQEITEIVSGAEAL